MALAYLQGSAKTYVQAALLGGHLGVVPCRWRLLVLCPHVFRWLALAPLKGDGLVANRLPRPGVFCFILQLIQSWRVLSRRSQVGLLRRLPGRGITWYCGKSRAPPMQTCQGART